MNRQFVQLVLMLIALFSVWQVLSPWTVKYALPGSVQIAVQITADMSLLFAHLVPTLKSAAIGLALGALLGILLGAGFHKSKLVRGILYGPSLCLFALPIVALAPLFALLLPPGTTPIGIALVTVFFPIAVTVDRALGDIDLAHRKLFEVYGASRWRMAMSLDVPSTLPAVLAGLQVAVPWSILGAMLGEFVGGRWGLGVLMLGDPWSWRSFTTLGNRNCSNRSFTGWFCTTRCY